MSTLNNIFYTRDMTGVILIEYFSFSRASARTWRRTFGGTWRTFGTEVGPCRACRPTRPRCWRSSWRPGRTWRPTAGPTWCTAAPAPAGQVRLSRAIWPSEILNWRGPSTSRKRCTRSGDAGPARCRPEISTLSYIRYDNVNKNNILYSVRLWRSAPLQVLIT